MTMLTSAFKPDTSSLNSVVDKDEIKILNNLRVFIDNLNDLKIVVLSQSAQYTIDTSLMLPNEDIYAANFTNFNTGVLTKDTKALLDIMAVFYHPGYATKLLIKGKIGSVVLNDMVLRALPLTPISATEKKLYWGTNEYDWDINEQPEGPNEQQPEGPNEQQPEDPQQ